MSINICKKNTQISQSTLKLQENMCKFPEAFATGLKKNISGKKNKRKYRRVIEKPHRSFNHSKRQEGYYTQGPNIFSAFNKLTLPGQFQNDVKEMVMPFHEMSTLMSGPEFMTAINNFNKIALHGVHVNHSLGINDEIILILFIVALIGSHYSKNNSLKLIASLGSLVFTLKLIKPGAVKNIYSYIFDKIKEQCVSTCKVPINTPEDLNSCYQDDKYEIVTQSLDLHVVWRLIVIAISGFTIAKNYGDVSIKTISKIDQVAKTLSPITSIFKSGGDILTTVISFIEGVVNLVGRWFNDDFRFAFGGEVWYELEILRTKLNDLKLSFERREDLGDIARKARALKSDLMSIRVPKDGTAYVQYRDLSNNIHVICDDLARLGAVGNDVRREPLVIVLSGTPGVGKSIISQHILDDMAYEILSKEQYLEYTRCSGTFIYPPNQTEKFMSGYTNQPFVTLDDLGYSPDSIEIMVPRFISMVNSMPYSVEQAELHRKGNVYFDSKLILATSNIFNWSQAANKLTSTEALCRRMHICIRVACKPEFSKLLKTENSNCQLDPKLVSNFDAGEWCNFSVYDPEGKLPDHPLCYHSLECKCDGPECREATFAELSCICVQTYRERNSYMESAEIKRKRKLQRMCDFEGDTLDMIKAVHALHTQGACDKYCVFHNGNYDTIDFMIPEILEKVKCGEACNKHCCHSLLTYEMYAGYLKDPNETYLPYELSKPVCLREYRTAMPQMDNCLLSTFEYLNMMKEHKKVDEKPGKFYHFLRYCKHTTHLAWEKLDEFCKGDFFKKFTDFITSPITISLIAIGISVCIALGLYDRLSNNDAECKRCGPHGLPRGLNHEDYYGKHKIIHKDEVDKCAIERGIPVRDALDKLFAQSIDHNALDVMKSLATSNVMHLFYNDTYFTTILGVMNEVVLINEHCLDKLKLQSGKINLYRQGKRGRQWRFSCDVSDLFVQDAYHFEGQDLMAIKIPNLLIRDITHLMGDDVFTSANSKTFGIAWFNPYSDDHEYNCFVGPSMQPLNITSMVPISAMDEDTNKSYTTTSWVKYEIPTIKGMCGAPIILMDASNKKKLVGIHCAGSNHDGYGVRITLRQMNEVRRYFGAYAVQCNVSKMSQENVFYDQMPETIIENCQVVGRVTPTATVLKTEIVKSPVYDRVLGAKPNLVPAILTPKTIDGKLICPIEKNLQDYARGFIKPDDEILKGVKKALFKKWHKSTSQPKVVRFLTFEEAVQGCPDLPFVRSINRGTSGGYPDKLYLGNKKRDAFGTDELFTFNTEGAILMRETYEEAMLALREGPIEMIANIFPKDELRAKEKVKQLKTRLIAGFSCSNTIVIRSIFGSFIDWFMADENRINNMSAVGVNPASNEWAKIALKHGYGSFNVDTKAGDHGSFDKRLHPSWMNIFYEAWYEFIGHKMSEEEQTIALNCWRSITNVVVVCKDNLIFWGNSNPSGNPLTTLINTICNIAILMYGITDVLVDKSKSFDYLDVVRLWDRIGDDIEITCYGDDNVWSVNLSSKFLAGKPALSYDNVGAALSKIGFDYTDEIKSTDYNETRRTIFQVGFLKRTFYKENGKVLAPLDLNTILQKIQWKKRGDANNELFFVKFATFVSELSVHPKEIYDRYHKVLFDALESVVPKHPISRACTQAEWREHWSKVCEAL